MPPRKVDIDIYGAGVDDSIDFMEQNEASRNKYVKLLDNILDRSSLHTKIESNNTKLPPNVPPIHLSSKTQQRLVKNCKRATPNSLTQDNYFDRVLKQSIFDEDLRNQTMKITDIANKRIRHQDLRAQSLRSTNFSSLLKNRLISLQLQNDALEYLNEGQNAQISMSTLEHPTKSNNQMPMEQTMPFDQTIVHDVKMDTFGNEDASGLQKHKELNFSLSSQHFEN